MDISELFDPKTKTPSAVKSGLTVPSQALALAERATREVLLSGFIQREIDQATAMQNVFRSLEPLRQSIELGVMVSRLISAELQAAQREAQSLANWVLESSRRAAAVFHAHLEMGNELLRWIEQFPCDDLFPELDKFLIEHGWYLSGNFPASVVFKLSDWFDAGDLAAIEQNLCGLYRHRTAEIEKELTTRFPKRHRLLVAAFRAHHSGDYALSVPAFLIQVDGISRELWRANFFRAGESNKSIDRMLRKGQVASLSPTLRRQLFERGSIRASSTQEGARCRFNRHAILHGNDTEFDREEYSLRCIALLDFMLSLCPLFERN